jgi:hypothetical protein
MKKFFTLFYIYLIISCDKNIGILFDVSGSMEDEFQSFNKINSFNDKKSDELTKILKNFSKNTQINNIIWIKKFTIYN